MTQTTEFTFLHSAISDALTKAHQLGCGSLNGTYDLRPISSIQMNEILMAAWRAQEAGDFNVTDLRTNKERLIEEILRLRKEAAQMRREWDESHWAKLEIAEVEEIQRYIKIVLKATRRLHQKRARFVEAWECLNRWVQQTH